MARFEHTIDIDVPVRVAYDQWTQLEAFPRFMEGVESVHQIDERRLHWRANVGGKVEEWDAEITEQIPDKCMAWASITGARNSGVVTFHRISDEKTRVMLQLEYEPTTWSERLGGLLGVMGRRVQGDLERFKRFIEERGGRVNAFTSLDVTV